MSKLIKNPHDRITKKLLSKSEIAHAFFDVHLPLPLKKVVDLDTLEPTKGTFVDAVMREHLTDILYKVQVEGQAGYLYLLIEAQHKPDPLMPFRILQYSVNIMRQHIDNQKAKGEKQQLPLLYPLIYYTGKGKYSESTDIFDNFAQTELAKRYFMKPFKLVSLNELPDNTIRRHKAVAALEMVQKHVHDRDMQQAFNTMLENGLLLQVVEQGGNYFQLLLQYSLNQGQFREPEQFLNSLIEHFPEQEKNVTTAAQYLENKGREQGMQQGKVEVAKKLLASGKLDAKAIADATDLAVDEVKALKH